MKKVQVTQNPRSTKPKKARSQKARSPNGQGERWSFSLGETEWGPFKTKGAKIDSRSLKTARSMGMVGLGNKAINIQRKMPRLSSSINENGNVVDFLAGTDFLAAVSSSSEGTLAGDILYKQEISPSLFLETRLRQFADLYQRYRFRKIHFLYEPVANATQSGQVLGFADFDVDNQLSLNTPENLSIAAAHQGEAITQIWEPMLFDMGQVFSFTDLYTEAGASDGSDARLSVQGVFYLIAASVIQSGIPLGNIYVDYEIEFSIPFLSAQVSSSRQSHGFIAATADADTGQPLVTSNYSVRSQRGPITSVASGESGKTLGWAGCRPGDVLWVVGSMNAVDADNGSTDSIALTVTANNATAGIVNARQIFVNAAVTWAFSFTLTVAETVGTAFVTADIGNNGSGSFAGAELNFGWVSDPAPTTSRGIRRQAQERDHARLKKMEDTIAQLLNRLQVASDSLPPTKERSVVSQGFARASLEFNPRVTRDAPVSQSSRTLSFGTSDQVRAGGAFLSHGVLHSTHEGPSSTGPLDRYQQ